MSDQTASPMGEFSGATATAPGAAGVNTAQPDTGNAEPAVTPATITAMTAMFGATVKQLATSIEAQQTAILGLTAMLALTPSTAQIDAPRLAVMIEALTSAHKNNTELQGKIAMFVSAIVKMSSEMPGVMAKARADEAKDAAAAAATPGPAGPKAAESNASAKPKTH